MMEILFPALLLIAVFFIFRTMQRNKQQAVLNKEAGKSFLAQNKNEPGVTETPSGLQYLILEKGTGDTHPVATSKVKVHYHGTLIDGRVFDSSVDRGEAIEFGLNQVIKGWTEGLQLMVKGDKFRLFIPSDLAYGDGSVSMITPGSTLIFDVELIDFN